MRVFYASLPGRIFPLLGPGNVPLGGGPPDEKHPPGPRHPPGDRGDPPRRWSDNGDIIVGEGWGG